MTGVRLDGQASRGYAVLLSGLLVLFTGRVVAQLVQLAAPVPFLPPFERWQSGALPYPLLLFSQLVIIGVSLAVIRSLARGEMVPSRRVGVGLLGLGALYGMAMCGRLLVGLTVAPDHYWFGATLPVIFHLVLAAFILVCGHFHFCGARSLPSSSGADTA